MSRLLLLLILCLLASLSVNSFRIPKSSLLVHKHVSKPYLIDTDSIFILKSSAFDLTQDFAATTLCTGLSAALIFVLTKLAKEDVIDTKLCRKLIHTLAAPCFVIFWPLYSSSTLESKMAASFLAFLQFIRLALAGVQQNSSNNTNASSEKESSTLPTNALSSPPSSSSSSSTSAITKTKNKRDDYNLADAISRSGNRNEAYGGPMIYCCVLFLSSLLFFRESPVGVVAICQMAVGDGLADIFGRRWGKVKWPFSADKSLVGSAAFVIGAFVSSCILLQWLTYTNSLSIPFEFSTTHILTLLFISVMCMFVELLPVLDDNITVPLAAALLAQYLL